MRYYAIGDLHGRFDLLKKAIAEIAFHAGAEDFRIVTLGDYVDRGPDSAKIIDYLMDYQRRNPAHLVCLQGNHEAMMVETIMKPLQPDWWIGNGGDATVRSYGWGGPPYGWYCYEVVPKAHLEWLKNLPVCLETEKQVFVHAGIPQYDMNLPPHDTPKGERLRDLMQWMLYDKKVTGGWRGKHVVHGHHQFADGPHVWHGPHGGRTNLDTFAWFTGRLVIGVFDDSQPHAIDFIEIKSDPNGKA